jgi:hypothetical protein
MKILLLLALPLLLALTSPPAAAQKTSISGQQLLKELQPVVDGWGQAVKNRDKAWFDKYLADDYIHTNPAGEVTDKARETADVVSPAAHSFSAIELVPLPHDRVRFYKRQHRRGAGALPRHRHRPRPGVHHANPRPFHVGAAQRQLVAFQATGVAKPFQK